MQFVFHDKKELVLHAYKLLRELRWTVMPWLSLKGLSYGDKPRY